MKSTIGERTNENKSIVSFGIKDGRGREIGARISTFNITFVQLPDDACAWYNMAPGAYYGLQYRATRNGNTYGAIQPSHFFKTEAERDTAIGKYLKDAKKRATKQEA